MTRKEKRKLRDQFFKAAGPNIAALVALFDRSNDVGFYIKDALGRIMALNRRNCEICRIRDEWDAIGLKSSDLFTSAKAESYMSHDLKVLSTGKPVLGWISSYPADDSRQFEFGDVYPLRDAAGNLIGTVCAYRLTPESENGVNRYKNLRRVSDFIQEHYAEDIRLATLASMAGMSESSFVRAFRETFGTSPAKYIIITRVNAARKMLEETDRLATDIASECGFYDQSHFIRIFKAECKQTPGQYRRNNRTCKLSREWKSKY